MSSEPGYSGKTAAESGPEQLRFDSSGLIRISVAVKEFGRSIGKVALECDQYTEAEKARAAQLIQAGIDHIAELWKALTKT